MSATHRIAAATAALRHLLEQGIAARDAALGQVHIIALSPDQIELTVARPTLNMMLYDVRPDVGRDVGRDVSSDVRRDRSEPDTGEPSSRRMTSLRLRVLLTAYGPVHDDAADTVHRLLGAAMDVLDEQPIVEAAHLPSLAPHYAELLKSLRLRIAVVPMSLEETSRLWSMLGASYRLSVVYELSILSESGAHTGAERHDSRERGTAEPHLADPPRGSLRELTELARTSDPMLVMFAGGDLPAAKLAASTLADSLKRELLVADLSAVVSRYIGETEKNLAQLFKQAVQTDAVLFLDEADALFGKRSEVKDSHDRFANQEVGYLLQLLEDSRGVVFLRGSSKMVIDPAVLRRVRYVVNLD